MVPSTQHLSGHMTTFRPMGSKENDVGLEGGTKSAFHTSS